MLSIPLKGHPIFRWDLGIGEPTTKNHFNRSYEKHQNIVHLSMTQKGGYVYIISNSRRTVLYIGSTSDIKRRMWEHKTGFFKGFSYKYNCTDLLYHEFFPDIGDTVARERQMKAWKRDWKLELIRKSNPDLMDQSQEWFDEEGKLKE